MLNFIFDLTCRVYLKMFSEYCVLQLAPSVFAKSVHASMTRIFNMSQKSNILFCSQPDVYQKAAFKIAVYQAGPLVISLIAYCFK